MSDGEGHRNEAPQMGRLSAAEVLPLTTLEAGSLQAGPRQGWLLQEALRGGLFQPLSSLR